MDAFICSHMIHHMASPVTFFAHAHQKMKPGGRIVVQELNTSLLLRFLLNVMKHEGWNYDVDIFDPAQIMNQPEDPWSANCAIPELLWHDTYEFEKNVHGFKVLKNELNEAFLFPLSGGVIAQSKLPIPELPNFMLKLVGWLDKFVVFALPGLFASGRSVVLEKC